VSGFSFVEMCCPCLYVIVSDVSCDVVMEYLVRVFHFYCAQKSVCCAQWSVSCVQGISMLCTGGQYVVHRGSVCCVQSVSELCTGGQYVVHRGQCVVHSGQ